MRNWYVNENPSGSWVAPSDITYEELILFLAPSLIPPIFGRTLPMRNWYAAVRSSKATSSQSRTLPMRNWYMSAAENSQDVKYSSICRTLPMRNWYQTYELHFCSPWGSDITYEELIQSFDFLLYFSLSFNWLSVGHYLWGIDTFKQFFSNSFSIREKSDITYEELIRILAEYFHLTYPPSDITYEELIQSSTVYSEVNEASKYVGHYLWGIDTPFLTDLTSVGRKHVGHYLWGIDTYMHRLFLLRHGL